MTLPFYVVAANRLAAGRSPRSWVRLELLMLAALSLAALMARFVILETTSTSITGGTVVGTALWFALGMGLAVISVAVAAGPREPAAVAFIRRRSGLIWLTAFALYAALTEYLPANTFIFDTSQQILTFVTFGVVALLLLLPAVFGESGGGLPRRFLANPVVAWFGLISYGLFLWHYAVVIELTQNLGPFDFVPLVALTVAITTAIAAASYYALERPFMRFKYRPLLRKQPPAIPLPPR